MRVIFLFFGATADAVGARRVEMSLPDGETARTIFEQIKDEFPVLSNQKLHYALNQTYATGNEIVRDRDEIAIFTAVSGG